MAADPTRLRFYTDESAIGVGKTVGIHDHELRPLNLGRD